jgi:two-component system, LytTR family, response regulator
VELTRFMQACNKAHELYQLKHATANQPAAEYFFVHVDYSLVKVLYADLVWIEGLRDYVKLHLKPPAKPLLVRGTVKNMEEELPASRFMRIHKSFMVAIESITAVRKNSIFIGEMELPIG